MEPADAPGTGKDDAGGKPGSWDEFKTAALQNTAIGLLAEHAEALSNAHAGGSNEDSVRGYNAAYGRVQAWCHRHIRNRWYEGDRANGYKPESILVAHNYGTQAIVRVSALVGINVIEGQVWLVLRNLMVAEDPGAPLVIHPIPDVTPEQEKRGVSPQDVIDRHFPRVEQGGVEVVRRWRRGHDPVVRAPLLNFNLQQAWVRGSTSPIAGTVKLGSDALASAGDFGDVMVAYSKLRDSAEARDLRTPFSQLYVNELPAAGFCNCAAWGSAIGFEDFATDMPYLAGLTGVYATSLPWTRSKVARRVDTIGGGMRLTQEVVHAMLPVYQSSGSYPPPLGDEPAAEPDDPTPYQQFQRQLNDPAERVYFDPVFECGVPIRRRRDPDTQQRLTELKASVVKLALARVIRGTSLSGEVSLENAEALRLLVATRSTWLREDVQAAIRDTLEGVYRVDSEVAGSRLGKLAIPLFTEYVLDPFDNLLEALNVEVEPAPGPGAMVPVAPGEPAEEEPPVPRFEFRPDVAPPFITDLRRMVFPDEVGPPPAPGVIPALPAPPGMVPVPAPVPVPGPGPVPVTVPPAVVPVPPRIVPAVPAPVVPPETTTTTPPTVLDIIPDLLSLVPVVPLPIPIPIPRGTRRLPPYRPTGLGTPSAIYGSLMRGMARCNVKTMGTSPRVRALALGVAGSHTWGVYPAMPVRLGTFEVRTLGAGESGRGLVLGWALQGAWRGKRLKHVGGQPVAPPMEGGDSESLGAFTLPISGTLQAVVSGFSTSVLGVGRYTVQIDESGRAAGWILDGTDSGVVGVVGGVTGSDANMYNRFRVRFLFFDADRIIMA